MIESILMLVRYNSKQCKLPVFDELHINSRLLKKTVGGNCRQGICNEVVKRAVPGVFYLCDILQFVIYRFNQGTFL